ncbi:beta-1,4-N-acetylgalactosaminyltransferase bre-4-like [Ornithodoros turicata]|uniref:beta-1,4-N-acetylgalactosaminyltransferase bre-4-like n=1 Tax=Ornithodoros turicata TaxID=34597 RepID=UPI003138680B
MAPGGFQRFMSNRICLVIALTVVLLVGFLFSSRAASYGAMVFSKTPIGTDLFVVRNVRADAHAAAHRGVLNATNTGAVIVSSMAPGTSDSSAIRVHLATSQDESSNAVKDCPLVPPNLVTRMKVITNPPPIEEQEKIFTDLMPGGRYTPKECRSRHRVAIIIPYRNRSEHLVEFLNYMHYMLKRQQLDYGIYVVEQAGSDPFNRGKLLNVGFLIASRLYDFQCFIFHDVDMIPEDDRNLYTCSDQPRHMTVAVSKFNYKLPYQGYFGGGCALSKSQVETINGFSNEYWGWGAEDDDLAYRVRYHKYKITRYSSDIARYTTLSHKQAEPSPARMKLLNKRSKRFKTDGINSTKYTIVDLVFKKLYTWIYVDLLYKKPEAS